MKAYKKGLSRYQIGLDRRLRRIERRLTKGLIRSLSKDFDELGVLAAREFTRKAPLLDLDLDFEGKSRVGLKGQDEDNAARILVSMDIEGWTKKRLQKSLEKSKVQAFGQVRDTVNDTLRVQLDPHGTVERRFLSDLGTDKGLPDIEGDTRKAIVRAIEQGRKEAMSTSEIADLIKREVPKGRFVNAGKKYRAEMIARTESRFAVNRSSMALYRNAHEVVAVRAIDGNSDPECEERNGERFTFDEAEAEDSRTHPNCSLRWVPVIAGE